MFALSQRDQSHTIVHQFETQWNKEVENKRSKTCSNVKSGVEDNTKKYAIDQVHVVCSYN